VGEKVKRAVELFAGVGGFRLGLEKAGIETVASNQWEPGEKKQFASEVYVKRFGPEGHMNFDISTIPGEDFPDHDILCGGPPCQSYSVARPLRKSDGLRGEKGVLFWDIHRIAKAKQPRFIFLENVDRMLSSPASQKGRDFAVILAALSDLGYRVEWRVVNAADYGFSQRRRRVFILASLGPIPLLDLPSCHTVPIESSARWSAHEVVPFKWDHSLTRTRG
jgi:DNA (cytosine-5)-methyltransferase 1